MNPSNNRTRVFITKSHAEHFVSKTSVSIRWRNAEQRLTTCELSANPHQPSNNRMRVFITESHAEHFVLKLLSAFVGGTQKQRLTATVACELKA
ncbi:hypothetical protein CEXT_619581 [Caerostris extrusa]|uniref:Uncharacterized protein n=1 Tax=Caerostris extrusa TaxID=172846 RepID=A0AAV4Y9E0_CAEEX|nr:hypothetical protein CEXT_619581 [Caerostris extrusa]